MRERERVERERSKYELRVFKTLIDLLDLQNDLEGQSYKSKLFLENLVEQIVTYIYLS
jgi:hypothetical protein